MTKRSDQEPAASDPDRAGAARACAWCDETLDAANAAWPRTSHGICEPCLEAATRGFVTPAGSGSGTSGTDGGKT